MFKKSLCILIGLTSSVVMAQDSYRLAYSKKDDIEIYIDNSTAENWCQTDLTLQVKGGKDASLERFSTLLPKLGGLFAAQCPQAATLTWSYVDATNTLLAKGASSADSQWGYQLTEQLVVPVAAVAEPVNDTSQSQQATAPPVPLVEPTAQVVKSTTADEGPIENSETVVPQIKTAYFPLSSIQIGDWIPPTKEQREALTNEVLTVRKNQEGCQLISQFNFGAQSDYIEIQTTNVSCDQGYLHGAGKIQLVRSDGAVVMKPRDVWFYHGLAFVKPVDFMHPEAISLVKTNNYWFSLGSDDSLQSHYLLPASLKNHNGLGMWHPDSSLHILVAESEAFKQAASIENHIKEAVNRLDAVAGPRDSYMNLRFVDQVDALYERYGEGRVYEISVDRRMPYNRAPEPWRYNMAKANNLLFQREQARLEKERQAEESRQRQLAFEQQEQERQQARLLRQKANAERQRLMQYKELQQMDLAKDNHLHNYLYKNIRFSLDRTRDYSYMLEGGERPFSMIVQVTGKKDQYAVVDWPYEVHIAQQADLSKGWYWIVGEQTLSSDVLDDKSLPITVVKAEPEAIYACKEKGCADLQDPLLLIRHLHQVPDWDPAQAEELIEQANASPRY